MSNLTVVPDHPATAAGIDEPIDLIPTGKPVDPGDRDGFTGWAVVELMGRDVAVGYVTAVRVESMPWVRVDVIDPDTPTSSSRRFYAPRSIFCVSPCTEAEALAAAADPMRREF